MIAIVRCNVLSIIDVHNDVRNIITYLQMTTYIVYAHLKNNFK